jgi:hypothetical protein
MVITLTVTTLERAGALVPRHTMGKRDDQNPGDAAEILGPSLHLKWSTGAPLPDGSEKKRSSHQRHRVEGKGRKCEPEKRTSPI